MTGDTYQTQQIYAHAPMPLAQHIRRTLAFAAPIIVARASLMIIFAVDSLMTGQAGADELAYLAVGIAPQMTLFLIAIGALQAVVVLVAQAIGAGRPERCGDILRTGTVLAALLGLGVLLLAFFSEAFFLAAGQSARIAAGAAEVSIAFGIGVPGLLLFLVANLFLEATDRPFVGMWIMIAANVANIVLNGILALGWFGLVEPLGAVGAVSASSILRWLAFLGAFAIIFLGARSDGDRYRVLAPLAAWRRILMSLGGDIGRRLTRLGVPMGLAQGVESAAFSAIVLIAGSLGESAAAAHQITITVMSLIYMVAIGTAAATAIRVGNAVGRGNMIDIRHAGWSGIGIGALLPVPAAILFIAVPDAVVAAFTTDPVVVEVAVSMVFFAGFLLSIDAIMAVAAGALRGVSDVWIPFAMQSCAFWCIGVPAAYVFAYSAGFGALGLIFGIAAGLVLSIALLLTRFVAITRA